MAVVEVVGRDLHELEEEKSGDCSPLCRFRIHRFTVRSEDEESACDGIELFWQLEQKRDKKFAYH